MAKNILKKGEKYEDVPWLKQILSDFGYLKLNPGEPKAEMKIFNEEIEKAIIKFCDDLGWDVKDWFTTDLLKELRREVSALQSQLITLGCLKQKTKNQQGDSGKQLQDALEEFRKQCKKKADDYRKKYPILKNLSDLAEPNAKERLRQLLDSNKASEIKNELIKSGFFKNKKIEKNNSNKLIEENKQIENAALKFREKLRALIETGQADVFNRSTRWLLSNTPPCTFNVVWLRELEAIREGRKTIEQTSEETQSGPWDPLGQAHQTRLMGLAFSGGGIRSATFNLGVLQALAQFGLLKRFDYLSTVSGGGYIGGWLHAWVKREKDGIQAVEKKLASTGRTDPMEAGGSCNLDHPESARSSHCQEPGQVDWLRRYSNYLTPRAEPLGTDAMAGVATWLRNVLLNQAILVLVACSVLFLPWIFTTFVSFVNDRPLSPTVGFLFGLVFLLIASCLAAIETTSGCKADSLEDFSRRKIMARVIAVLFCLSCVLIGFFLPMAKKSLDVFWTCCLTFLAYSLPAIIYAFNDSGFDLTTEARCWRRIGRSFSVVIAGGLLAFSFIWLARLLPEPTSYLKTVLFGPLSVLVALLLVETLYIGLAGRALQEMAREWWSRLGGVLLRAGLLWLAITGVALYGAYGLMYTYDWVVAFGGLTWVTTTVAGVIAGRSAKTSGTGGGWREMTARIAPYVFVVGLVLLLSWGLHSIIIWAAPIPEYRICERVENNPDYVLLSQESPSGEITANGMVGQAKGPPGCSLLAYSIQGHRALEKLSKSICYFFSAPLSPLFLFVLPLIASILAFLLSWRCDVNVFAFHMFYRNRLERCYLGGSVAQREADPYTDLDPEDSPDLDELKLPNSSHGQRPYPLINAALNLTRPDNLAWQERKAASFVFTPQHCGYQLPGAVAGAYQKTDDYVCEIGGRLPIGTAMTVSGAAASPNAGYHTHWATAALMTVFNVRLGLWIQNPAKKDIWRKPGPKLSLRYLFKELISWTTEEDNFVYVSDGGHLENLGLYELVRRRCRYIVVCDAGCDPKYTFEDLGNAIRKCKVDFGIDIDIDTRAIVPNSTTGLSQSNCTIGVIHYEKIDSTPEAAPGYLLYVKASYSGDEPADLRHYRAEHCLFPHENTGDQWYSESQFESCRALGFHIMTKVFKDAYIDERRERTRRNDNLNKDMREVLIKNGNKEQVQTLDREILFRRLAERWYPPSRFGVKSTKHEQTLQELIKTLRTDKKLYFLDTQLCPELIEMTKKNQIGARGTSKSRSSPTSDDLRAGFYFCNQLIELMEDIYHDGDLDWEYAHPDNRGWMNLFRHWRDSWMVRVAWAVSATNYDSRFQQFCGRHLGMDLGRVILGKRIPAMEFESATDILSVQEIHQLRALKDEFFVGGGKWLEWEKSHVIPLELKVADPKAEEEIFRFIIGFALIKGEYSVVQGPESSRNLFYFQIREHLRQAGLGRRGLEALWREDAELEISVPSNIASVIKDADEKLFARLWTSMLAGVPHSEIKRGHAILTEVERDLQAGNDIDSKINKKRLKGAKDEFRKVLAQQSDNEEAWRGMARIFSYRKNDKESLEKAISILDNIITRNENFCLVFYNRASTRMKMYHPDINLVFKDLRIAIEIDHSLKLCAKKDSDFNGVRQCEEFKNITS